MNNEEARKILALYRPGTADQTDPSFKEALERAKPDAAPAGGKTSPSLSWAVGFKSIAHPISVSRPSFSRPRRRLDLKTGFWPKLGLPSERSSYSGQWIFFAPPQSSRCV